MKTSQEILEETIVTLSTRGLERNESTGERSMLDIVNLFNELTKRNLTESDGWYFMICLKLVRSTKGFKDDDYVDLTSYSALLGESKHKEKNSLLDDMKEIIG